MEIKKCSCGAEAKIEFGFSCTLKPKATIYCKKCGKSVTSIGNDGTSVFELWGTEQNWGQYNGEK